jgi:hypothetical protein
MHRLMFTDELRVLSKREQAVFIDMHFFKMCM